MEELKKIFLTSDSRKLWISIFCAISFLVCVFYTPYEQFRNNVWYPVEKSSTIFESPSGYYRTRIDYSGIVFREFIIAVSCIAGYSATLILKKR